ncbi:hypothetical protein BCR32DRAFT_270421 [Anaeromyces robustus]|uniref:Shieldin complex subunit 2 first OB fold domain-containing protein n=1 Tax=Anaeromyces robustus TaxID=1754192 RepID=A0A1Y1WWF1_9FUNG|nr:hypothetical protein BCR32DRAFT_270421 [Anaeromyces robustus]|eukprot:ORX77833.1 hypothetical protein BCR32DRAFT_270421 [Anaeromyces robustus]
MLSSQTSNPRDLGIPSSIPKTISTISSFDESPIEDLHYPMILPSDIEIVNSLDTLIKQYPKDQSLQKSYSHSQINENENPNPNIMITNSNFNSTSNNNIYKPKKKYNFIGIIVQIDSIKRVQPKNQTDIFDTNDRSIPISSILISDPSRSLFPVIFWRNNSNWIEKFSLGDIVLFINFTLSNFKNKIMANTVGWGNNNYSSRFYILKNINSKSSLNINVDVDLTKRVLDIQNWAKTDFSTKHLFKDSDQFSSDIQTSFPSFLTIKQLTKYKNKCVSIQGIPISIMKDIRIEDDNATTEFWKVEILDVENNTATIQIINMFFELFQYIHINEKRMYDFYDLIVHKEENKELVLYATKYTKIQTSNNIPTNIQNKLIDYTKVIKPKNFDSIELLIKSRYNAKIDAFISKIIINRTNTSAPIEYSMNSSYKHSQESDTIDDILNTIQIYCNQCNELLLQEGDINITSLINGICYKDSVEKKINYFIKFIIQKAFQPHCHHLKDLIYVFSPIQLILQDTLSNHCTQPSSQEESTSSPSSSPISSSPLSTSSKFNSIFVFLDINSTKQFYDHKLNPELFIKIKGGLKRKGRISAAVKKDKITLTMIQNHLRKDNPFTLASASTSNVINNNSSLDDKSSVDFNSKIIDITHTKIFDDLLSILSFKEDPSKSINFNTNRNVLQWNQNLKKYIRPHKRKKNTFILSCNIQENELKTNLYNVGPIYCKNFKNN